MKTKNLKYSLVTLMSLIMTLASCSQLQIHNVKGALKDSNVQTNQKETSADGIKSTADEKEPSDLNIYLAYDGAKTDRDYVWGWSEDPSLPGSLFPVADVSPVTFEKTGDIKFIPVYLKFGQKYASWTNWSDKVTTDPTSSFELSADSIFTGLLFRDASGDKKDARGDLMIDPSKVVVDSNGQRNIYIDDTKGVFYSIDTFPVTNIDTASYQEKVLDDKSVKRTIEVSVKKGRDLTKEINPNNPFFLDLCLRQYKYVDGQKTIMKTIRFDQNDYTLKSDYASFTPLIDGPLDLRFKYELAMRPELGADVAPLADIDLLSYYSSYQFDQTYYTNEKLGAFVVGDTTVFKIWSPSASFVKLNLYQDQAKNELTSYDMKRSEKGVFSIAIQGNLNGWYYTFDINNYGDWTTDVPDPYAYSSNANGKKSMVVDFNTVNTEAYRKETNWAPKVKNYAGVTIMEMHTRDFTSNASWNGTEANRGKFNGLHESGTKLANGTATGFDYVKQLHQNGLTHVQILPAYDFASVDETKLDDPDYKAKPYGGIYNWGYDPQQYNAPEGSYSSNPNNGLARVNEFRDFVDAYNKEGVGVVMDVVYNHMPSQTGASFESVFPGYYFRSIHNSGAGADVASQRGMVRKFIVDSVIGWAKNYHISGFRFDLMGLLDMDTMVAVRKALDQIDPNILLYGEGWSMYGGDSNYGKRHYDMATQGNINTAGENWFGAFNDDYRDSVSGGNTSPDQTGYIQQALGYAGADVGINDLQRGKIYYGLSGTYYTGNTGRFTYSPSSSDGIGASIAYFECHDNMTLYDRFAISRKDANVNVNKEVIMANDNLMGALSSAFFQIGQDFGKSKRITDKKYLVEGKYYEDPLAKGSAWYSHDSYNLSDAINSVNWNLLDTNKDISDAFREALRRRSTIASQLGDTYSCNDFYDKGKFTTDLALSGQPNGNKYVLSYKLTLADGKNLYFGQNFSNADVTLDGVDISIPSGKAVSVIK